MNSSIAEALKAGKVPDLENIIKDVTLTKQQVEAITVSLVLKKCIISMSTGLGKTYVASALANAIEPRGKILIVLKRETLDELFPKFRKLITARYNMTYITKQGRVKFKALDCNTADYSKVIMVSSDALLDEEVNDYLYEVRSEVDLIIIDEMHLFSNLTSRESQFISGLISVAEYAFALTATPFEREIIQVLNILYALNPKMFGGMHPNTVANKFRVFRDGQLVGYHDLETLSKFIRQRCIIIKPEDCGIKRQYRCFPIYAKAKPGWENVKRKDAFKVFKSDLDADPYFKLIEVINDNIKRKRKGLIYINLNQNKKPIYERLKSLGYRVGIVDGSVSIKNEREWTKEQFRSGELDILITNRVTSLDLVCDYIVFYEFSLAYIQFRGRGSRGYNDSLVDIYYILTKGTVEETKFREEVLNRIKPFEVVMQDEVKELHEAFDF